MTMFSDGMLLGVGGDSPLTYVEASAVAAGTAGATISKPASTALGDTMVAVVWVTSALAITPPAGWTLIGGGDWSNNIGVGIYLKPAGGSEPSNYAFTSSAGTVAGQILLLRDGTGDLDAAGAYTFASSTVSTAAAFTAGHAGILIGAFAIRVASRTVSTPPSGMTQVGFYNTTSVSFGTYIIAPSAGGSIPSKTLTWSGTLSSNGGIAL